jgi:hypothetical protein
MTREGTFSTVIFIIALIYNRVLIYFLLTDNVSLESLDLPQNLISVEEVTDASSAEPKDNDWEDVSLDEVELNDDQCNIKPSLPDLQVILYTFCPLCHFGFTK